MTEMILTALPAMTLEPAPPPDRSPVLAKRKLMLWVDDVTVDFDGFLALEHLTLAVDEGELRCIIGPNGAGKTTLMDVITGKTRATCVGRKFQRPTVFHGHTVYENLELACGGKRGVFRSLFGGTSRAEQERIERALEAIGLKDSGDRRAGLLAHGHKQWLEIGMLLVQEPKVLLIDEPVAGMSQTEMDRTAELLRNLAGERTVIVVEHDMDFVRGIAENVTVLHEGKVLAEGKMDQVQKDPRVIEVYLGA